MAALAALVLGGGTLAQFGPGIPWTASTIARAEKVEQQNWGAQAAVGAIARVATSITAAPGGGR